MGRRPTPGGATLAHGISLWINAEAHALLVELARVEERSVQTVLRRSVMQYAEHSEEFQRWMSQRDKTKAAQHATHPPARASASA